MAFKKLLASIAAIGVVCAAGAFTPPGNSGSIKAKNFDPAGLGLLLNPQVDGMAMVKFDEDIGGSEVHMHMHRLDGNTTYGVAFIGTGSFSPDFSNPEAFTTNPGGKGTFSVSLPGFDLGPSPIFVIYEWDQNPDPDSILEIAVDELRAIGTVNIPLTPAVKIKDFSPEGPGVCDNPRVDGMAVVKYNLLFAGSDVHLHVKKLEPNTTYGVALQATGAATPDFSNPEAFTTNARGEGTFETTLPGFDLGFDPVIYIYIWDGNTDPDSILEITESEERASATHDDGNCHRHHNHHRGRCCPN